MWYFPGVKKKKNSIIIEETEPHLENTGTVTADKNDFNNDKNTNRS